MPMAHRGPGSCGAVARGDARQVRGSGRRLLFHGATTSTHHRSKTFGDESVPAGNGVAASGCADGPSFGRHALPAAPSARLPPHVGDGRTPSGAHELLKRGGGFFEPPQMLIIRGDAAEAAPGRRISTGCTPLAHGLRDTRRRGACRRHWRTSEPVHPRWPIFVRARLVPPRSPISAIWCAGSRRHRRLSGRRGPLARRPAPRSSSRCAAQPRDGGRDPPPQVSCSVSENSGAAPQSRPTAERFSSTRARPRSAESDARAARVRRCRICVVDAERRRDGQDRIAGQRMSDRNSRVAGAPGRSSAHHRIRQQQAISRNTCRSPSPATLKEPRHQRRVSAARQR